MAAPIAIKQYGLVQASGVLASIIDGSAGSGWAPAATDLATYTANFLDLAGLPNSAASFPGFEFDFGVPVRLSSFLLQVETPSTLARGMLVTGDTPASSPANMVQAGDRLLGIYTQAQLCGGHILDTRAKQDDIQGRYVRLVFRSSAADAPPDTSDPGFVDPSRASQFDNPGPFAFVVPEYTGDLIIEGWGAGASGGVTSTANAGGSTTVRWNDSTGTLTVNGGGKSALTVPNSAASAAAGGTASGANIANITGGNGGTPTPTSTDAGYTGKGGDAPAGGQGGDVVNMFYGAIGGANSSLLRFGQPGRAPGGGGSGKGQFTPTGDLLAYKNPGGAAGGYFKHKLTRGDPGVPNPGDLITGTIGAGGVGTNYDGPGANGRVKFSYSA